MKIQRYKHDSEFSYALGATLTYEMLKCTPESVSRVFLSPALKSSYSIDQILKMCEEFKIPLITSDKIFNIMSPKGNCFVIGEFYKKESKLQKTTNHIVLAEPADAGNMGTILRTATGFGFGNVAIIRPAVDVYDPKTIRASMGAVFHLNVEYFNTIEEYCERFPENARYAFMLRASRAMKEIAIHKPYSLIFGNEATGLPDRFADFCDSVVIKHTHNIDSLNLTIAAGIAMYEFTKAEFAN